MQLKIQYVPIGKLKTYARNAKLHPAEQIEQLKKSIEEFGFNDPIAIWGDDTIIEGHGRLIAAQELGLEKVPVIRLDGLTDEQRKAYALVHNKLTMNSGFDFALLQEELRGLDMFDMSDFGFGDFELGSLDEDFEPDAFDPEVEEQYPDKGLVSHNVIICCLNEEEKEWVRGLLHEDGKLKRLYDASDLIERFEGDE